MNEYADIINLPRPVSQRHAHMSPSERAAQFMPFAALTGYEALVNETVRERGTRPELSESRIEEINRVLLSLHNKNGGRVNLTYVEESLGGGDVQTLHKSGEVTRIDISKGIIVLDKTSAVFFSDIINIEEI